MADPILEWLKAQQCDSFHPLEFYMSKPDLTPQVLLVRIQECERLVVAGTLDWHTIDADAVPWEHFNKVTATRARKFNPFLFEKLEQYFATLA